MLGFVGRAGGVCHRAVVHPALIRGTTAAAISSLPAVAAVPISYPVYTASSFSSSAQNSPGAGAPSLLERDQGPGGLSIADLQERNLSWRTGGRQSVSGLVATVFGCTGFAGRYVVNYLGKIGSQVICPFRGDGMDARRLKLSGDLGQIVLLPCDPRNQVDIERAVSQSNVVINLIGAEYETNNWSYEQVNVDLARTIAEASKSYGVERLVHVSHMGAAANSPSLQFSTKYAGERAVLEAFPDATILRPAPIFGEEDRFLNTLCGLANVLPVVPLVNKGRSKVQPVYVADVAGAVLSVLAQPHSLGQTYNVAGPEVVEYRELYHELYKAILQEPNTIGLPKSVARLYGRAMQLVPRKFRLFSLDQVEQQYIDLTESALGDARPTVDLDLDLTSLSSVAPKIYTQYRKTRGDENMEEYSHYV